MPTGIGESSPRMCPATIQSPSGARRARPARAPRRILEVVVPAGFEGFLNDGGGAAKADAEALGIFVSALALEMDPQGVPGLIVRLGVRFPSRAAGARGRPVHVMPPPTWTPVVRPRPLPTQRPVK